MEDHEPLQQALMQINSAAICLNALTQQMLCPLACQRIDRCTAEDILGIMQRCAQQIKRSLDDADDAL